MKAAVITKRLVHHLSILWLSKCRADVEQRLNRLAAAGTRRFEGTTLIDGTFDNPNYWFRLSILRAAKGTHHGREVCVLGPFRAASAKRTAQRLGIMEAVHFPGDMEISSGHQRLAETLVASLRSPDDLMKWDLPYGAPAWDLYDGLLKRQRLASLDISHPLLARHVAEYMRDLDVADSIVNQVKPDFAVLSHTASARTNYGALTWQLSRRNVPVIVPQGGYGNLTHFKINKFEDVFNHPNRPSRAEIDELSAERRDMLHDVGRRYIAARISGQTSDLAAVQAFQEGKVNITRGSLCALYGWSLEKPIVAVFASVWFDNPHTFGMTEFRDFHEWLQSTIAVACGSTHVNWLFKPHPSENWYGGVKLRDLLPKDLPAHVRIAEDDWDGAQLRDCLRGIVTLHGTGGVEMAAVGKPVLVAARGWYADVGFVAWPRSRQAYFDALASQWWENLDLVEARRLAEIFAGYYFCKPGGGGSITLPDDSIQHLALPRLKTMLASQGEDIAHEVATMSAWLDSDTQHYHVFKMKHADCYELP